MANNGSGRGRPTFESLTMVTEGSQLHLVTDGSGTEVWLDIADAPITGLCIGFGPTRATAIEDAITELRARLVDLERARRGAERSPS